MLSNPFVPNAPFLDPPKTPENQNENRIHGVEKGCIGNEWVKVTIKAPQRRQIKTFSDLSLLLISNLSRYFPATVIEKIHFTKSSILEVSQ